MRRRSPSLAFVFFTLLLDVCGFGLLIPVAPKLVAHVQGLPTEGAEHSTSISVGMLMATYAVMSFIFAPILGSLSDRFGRRPVLLCALFGSGIDYVAAAVSAQYFPSLSILFFTRIINGISGGTVPVCTAYIADVTPPEKRGAAFGIVGAAFGLGFVIGPLLGGWLGDSATRIPLLGHGSIFMPYYGAAVLTLANFLFGLFLVPESLLAENHRRFSWEKANPLGALRWLRGHHVVVMLAATLFFSNLAQFSLHATWVLSMQARFGWTPHDTGWSLFTVGIMAFVVQGILGRKLIPKLGERACLIAGLILGVFAFLGYGLATEGWMIYVIIAIASLGGVAGPAAQAIGSKAIGPTEQGLLQGALGSLASIAMILGPLIGAGAFYLSTSPGAPRFPGPSASFYASSFLCLLSIIPIVLIWDRLPTSVKQAPIEGFGPGACPNCGYDRSGLAPAAPCPECNAPSAPATTSV